MSFSAYKMVKGSSRYPSPGPDPLVKWFYLAIVIGLGIGLCVSL